MPSYTVPNGWLFVRRNAVMLVVCVILYNAKRLLWKLFRKVFDGKVSATHTHSKDGKTFESDSDEEGCKQIECNEIVIGVYFSLPFSLLFFPLLPVFSLYISVPLSFNVISTISLTRHSAGRLVRFWLISGSCIALCSHLSDRRACCTSTGGLLRARFAWCRNSTCMPFTVIMMWGKSFARLSERYEALVNVLVIFFLWCFGSSSFVHCQTLFQSWVIPSWERGEKSSVCQSDSLQPKYLFLK